tara:strand:- start:723 stop:1274 length:552 start_codon:yes stop_codon:yes gene_type:complete
MQLKPTTILILSVAFIFSAALVMCDRMPESSVPVNSPTTEDVTSEVSANGSDMSDADKAIDEAIKTIEAGEAPMQGILVLLELADADEPNIRANYLLGKFGIQSGQMEKAVDRFNKVIELDPNLGNAYFYLARCYEALGRKDEALQTYKNYLPLAVDTVMSQSVETFINRLEADAKEVVDPNT